MNSHVFAPATLLGAWADTILGAAVVGIGEVDGVGWEARGVGTGVGVGVAAAGVGTGAGVAAGGDGGTEFGEGEGTASGIGAAGAGLDGAGAQPAVSVTNKIKRIITDFILYLCQLVRYLLAL